MTGTTRLATAAAAAAGVLLTTAGCLRTQQFETMLRYDNLMPQPDADAATAAAREQLLARAAAHGLEPTVATEHRLRFRTLAPRYVVTLNDGTTEERQDPRVVHIEVFLNNTVGEDVYRYRCRVEGTEPKVFTPENRARFGLSLLALREIFETPIEMELLGGSE